MVVFLVTFCTAYAFGFVPYYMDGTASAAEEITLPADYSIPDDQIAKVAEYAMHPEELAAVTHVAVKNTQKATIPVSSPTRIVIDDIKLDLPIDNPETTNVAALDELLKKAVVRYPTSAKMGENGNMLIFGHTSHLPVVHNQMYRAFNNLPNLTKGALIQVQSDKYESTYRVTSIRHADANDEVIDLSGGGENKLTLVTCDTFGAKTARWIVEAELVGSYAR